MSNSYLVEVTAASVPEITVIAEETTILEVSAPSGPAGPAGPQGLDGFFVAELENQLPPGIGIGTVWVKPV